MLKKFVGKVGDGNSENSWMIHCGFYDMLCIFAGLTSSEMVPVPELHIDNSIVFIAKHRSDGPEG